jgi:CheY-like chemotaxis protein
LNMIVGSSEMITQAPHVYGGQLPDKLLADINIICTNGQHLASLINDVLDLSQIDASRMALAREWTAVAEIVEAALLAVRPLFESKGLFLEKDVPEGLPLLFCDRTRIRQVILNLLSNAGRFTEQGGTRVRVQQQEAGLVVSVSDTGPGIAPEHEERIFKPFTQADGSIRRRYGGSGLGLAISKQFVELHGGKMWLETTPGAGTTFHFSLPLQPPAPPAQRDFVRWVNPYQEHEPRTQRSKAPEPRLTPRFVVLEAGNTVQRLLHRYRDGVEVVGVRNLTEAFTEVSRVPAQALIVNDLAFRHMPATADSMASLPYGTPVIMCWLPDNTEAAQELGLMDYLVKPFSRERLLSALDALERLVRTVLVVDDEPDVLQLLARMLASANRGYHVLRASTGQRALTLLRQRRPDVMLLDLVMPGMDGYAVLEAKSQELEIKPIPVIAITAQDLSRGPLSASVLSVSRSGGLYPRDVLNTIEALSAILAPPDRLSGGTSRDATPADPLAESTHSGDQAAAGCPVLGQFAS